jgi:hypothetical protein
LSKTKYQTLFNKGSTIASVIAAEKLAPVKYITQEAAITKWPIVYMTVLMIVPRLASYTL